MHVCTLSTYVQGRCIVCSGACGLPVETPSSPSSLPCKEIPKQRLFYDYLFVYYKNETVGRPWWLTPLILTHGRQRKARLCEFKECIVYMKSSRPARVTQWYPAPEPPPPKPSYHRFPWSMHQKQFGFWSWPVLLCGQYNTHVLSFSLCFVPQLLLGSIRMTPQSLILILHFPRRSL